MKKLFSELLWKWWEIKLIALAGFFIGCAIGTKWSSELETYFNSILTVGILLYVLIVYIYFSKIYKIK